MQAPYIDEQFSCAAPRPISIFSTFWYQDSEVHLVTASFMAAAAAAAAAAGCSLRPVPVFCCMDGLAATLAASQPSGPAPSNSPRRCCRCASGAWRCCSSLISYPAEDCVELRRSARFTSSKCPPLECRPAADWPWAVPLVGGLSETLRRPLFMMLLRSQLLMKLLVKAYNQVPTGVSSIGVHVRLVLLQS